MDKTVAVPGETLPKKIEYSYDNVGNMTLRKETDDANNVTTFTKTFDSADRLTQVAASPGATVTYSYDLNSNLTGDSTGRSFSWNGLDQLTSMTASSTTTSFGYDPLGRRKTWTQGSTSKAYYYDGLNLLNDGTSSFLNGAGIDEPLERTASSTISTYLQDHLGSVTQVTNASGVSTGQYAYTPFGKLLSSSTPVAGNPFSYTAREDDGTGLYYYRARYYDPSLEAFLSQDPYGDAQRYAGGNPISFIDPLGLKSLVIYYDGNPNEDLGNQWTQTLVGKTVHTATSPTQLQSVLNHFVKSELGANEPFEELIIVSHGDSLHIGQWNVNALSTYPGVKNSTYMKSLLTPLKDRTPEKISLFACRTGKGQNSFAQGLSGLVPNTPVFAPNGTFLIGPFYEAPDSNVIMRRFYNGK